LIYVGDSYIQITVIVDIAPGSTDRVPSAKLIVGRNREDNEGLQQIESEKYVTVKLPIAGPFSLLNRDATEEEQELAAKIAITYARSSPKEYYEVTVGEDVVVSVSPFTSKKEAQRYFFNNRDEGHL